MTFPKRTRETFRGESQAPVEVSASTASDIKKVRKLPNFAALFKTAVFPLGKVYKS